MIFWGETGKKEKIFLGEPKEVLLKRDADAPADMLELIYLEDKNENLEYIYAYENSEIVFAGIVDEQISSCNSNGMQTRIIARSLAALLLDNEAMPQTLLNPSLRVIAERYLKPLGFNCVIGERKSIMGAFRIPKGSSCWAVLEGYCRTFLGSTPYISPDGVVYAYTPSEEEVILKNVSELEIHRRPYKRIAKVMLQSESGAYDALFANAALKSGKVRYAAQSGGKQAADIIREGEEQSVLYRVKTAGFRNIPIHSRVTLLTPTGERHENLVIESMTYKLLPAGNSPVGESQSFTLRKSLEKLI